MRIQAIWTYGNTIRVLIFFPPLVYSSLMNLPLPLLPPSSYPSHLHLQNLLPYRLLFIREKLSHKFFSLRGRMIGNIYSFNDPGENFGQNLFCENVRSRLFEIIEVSSPPPILWILNIFHSLIMRKLPQQLFVF